MRRTRVSAWFGLWLLTSCGGGPRPEAAPPGDLPEAATGVIAQTAGSFRTEAVVAANPHAAEAGARVLAAGGSAVDAAVAVQMVLTVVEPQSSGIGGGAFLLHWDGQQVEAWDGRETAPAAADERLFLDPAGKPRAFHDAVVGGLSVGVPGAVRMLEAAHRAHGRRPWASLFEEAIRLCDEGFEVSPRLNALLEGDVHLRKDPAALRHFYDAAGRALPVGTRLKNPPLAAVFRALAAQGADALHTGHFASAVVQGVRAHPSNPGRLSLADLEAYRPIKREASCAEIDRWRICGMPPPSSGALAVGQILGILARVPAGRTGAASEVDFVHRYVEASRLAFADRALYVADPAFVKAPGTGWGALLSPAYLEARAALVGARAAEKVEAGVPEGTTTGALAPDPRAEFTGTSHVSIVDAEGRAVALTTSIEDAFGARLMVEGFLLNNQLTDFSFVPEVDGRPVANRVEPGKRPRSSMSPTLVFDRSSGALQLVVGSPGGAPIIHYTARTAWGALWAGQPLQTVVDAPNFGFTGGPVLLEVGRFEASMKTGLEALGHKVEERPLPSGIHALMRIDTGWSSAADPRREGAARGR
jgi:gamma-glutamyltranspeptidase/glutathione hydrolase